MNRSRIITLGIVFVFLLVNVIPVIAAGSTVKVIIENKSESSATLTLWGPYHYLFNLRAGKNRFEIEKGLYNYTYFGCGRYFYGTFNANRNNAKLSLECKEYYHVPEDIYPLNISNNTGNEFVLRLTGDYYYSLTVKQGKNVFPIKMGRYSYSHNACGEEETGKLWVNRGGGNLKLRKCKSATTASSRKGIRIKISNQTGGKMILTLRGATTLTFTLYPGNSAIYLPKGSYSYSMVTQCGTRYGSINLNKPILWIWRCN